MTPPGSRGTERVTGSQLRADFRTGDAFTDEEVVMQLSASMLVVLMLVPSAARGQTAAAALPSVDVAAATGWFAADRSVNQECCSSWSSSLFKGVSAGYYWTEHLKTEVELAAPGPTEGYTVLSEQV